MSCLLFLAAKPLYNSLYLSVYNFVSMYVRNSKIHKLIYFSHFPYFKRIQYTTLLVYRSCFKKIYSAVIRKRRLNYFDRILLTIEQNLYNFWSICLSVMLWMALNLRWLWLLSSLFVMNTTH